MKNILLILVGGTICTALNEQGDLSVNKAMGSLLKSNFETSDSPYARNVHIELSENLYILSENMTVDKWNLILDTYRRHTKEKQYDGVIFAHGTDTLAYSAALFSQLFSGVDTPIFFVSAHERLTSPATNGNANFRCAVECICRGITPNVYVPYQNPSDGQLYLHLASHLRQCENYSDDFHSVDALNITSMTEDNYTDFFKEIEARYPKEKRISSIDLYGDWKLKPCVLMIEPYVGINYAAFDYAKFSAVLHGAFHSGTACADNKENSILSLLDRCAETANGADVYFSPSILRKGTYETVSVIGAYTAKEKRFRFLYGYTKEVAYAKILIAYSLFDTDTERRNFIETERNFERIDSYFVTEDD